MSDQEAPDMPALKSSFFDRDVCLVAKQLLGKIIYRKVRGHWLSARIIETEAYTLEDKGSHASLGYTEKRKALFMPAGAIYMYYARGKDSLNISTGGKGDAVLIKSAFPTAENSHRSKCTSNDYFDNTIKIMQQLNPANSGEPRSLEKLCCGQTLLCTSMDLKVTEWDQQQFDEDVFYIDDKNNLPDKIIQTTRLGIPPGRDEHLPYRFIEFEFARFCSSNPLTKRHWFDGIHYKITG